MDDGAKQPPSHTEGTDNVAFNTHIEDMWTSECDGKDREYTQACGQIPSDSINNNGITRGTWKCYEDIPKARSTFAVSTW